MVKPPRDIQAEFRAEALQILARRHLPNAERFTERELDILKPRTSPAIIGGRVELHSLANGVRLDIIGRDDKGRLVRMETRHYSDIRRARELAALAAVVLAIPYHDMTGEGRA